MAVSEAGAAVLDGPFQSLEGEEREGRLCLIGRALSGGELRELLARAPEEIRGSIDDVDRRRTLQLQFFRILAYFVGSLGFVPYIGQVGALIGVPVLLGLANAVAYFLLRNVGWFRGLNTALFVVDFLATEFMIWQFGTLVTPFVMFLPILVMAAVFYLPSRSAAALTFLLLAMHGGLLLGHAMGVVPVGPIAREMGFTGELLELPLVIGSTIVSTFLFLLGAFFFARRALGLLRQREFEVAQANEIIRRYVPTQLAEQILAGHYGADAAHERRKLTIFFSDIKGFTETADQLEAEDLSRILNEYLSEMAAIAEKHGGTIDKFVGDAIMIFFGAPLAGTDKEDALRAVCMARQMQWRMAELKTKWFEEGIQVPFEIRIGINTGAANVGSFGSTGRMDYTAIGTQVNLAARIQSQCEPGKVLVSHSTWGLVHDQIACREKGEIQAKGIHFPVKVYEVAAE